MRTIVFTARRRIQPDVHDAHLDLRRPGRRLHHRPEIHPFLKDVLAPQLPRNGRNLLRRRPHYDPRTRKRIERLQHVPRRIPDIPGGIEKTRARHRRMPQVWQRELTQPEKPVRVPRPFHIQIVAEIERKLRLLALQLVHDGPVVDAPHRDLAAIQPPAPLAQLADVHSAHAVLLLRQQEIVARLLLPRVDLREHHLFRVVPPRDSLPQDCAILLAAHTPRQLRQSRVDAVRFAIAFGHQRLISIQRGEALNLDQLRLQVLVESEIGLHEKRPRILVRRTVRRGHRRARHALIFFVREQLLHHLAAVPCHRVHQRGGQEARRFRVPEKDRLAAAGLQQSQKPRILRGRVLAVKPLPVRGNQAGTLRRP